MRRAWLLAFLVASPVALAQTPPTPTAGQITVGEVLHTSTDKFINATECNGAGTVRLAWRIAGFPTNGSGVTWTLYAANKDTTGACPKSTDSNITAGPVSAVVAPNGAINPMTDATYATSVIVATAGKGACNQSAPEDIFLCAEGVGLDPSGVSSILGQARGKLTLDLRAPVATSAASASPGENAINVSWAALPATADPGADYYLVDAQQIGTTTAAFDPQPIHTSGPVTGDALRLSGLVNSVVYQVRVFTFSAADNRSSWEPANVITAMPEPVNDFWEGYQAAGGQEQGGCASGLAGPLGLAAVAGALALRRRRK